MTWTPDIVKHRFIEAARTEMRLPQGGLQRQSGFWPAYVHSFEDMSGWGTRRLAEERELRSRRLPPSAAAISRHMEVLAWTSELIAQLPDRETVWGFAFCIAYERSFSEWCRKRDIVRKTAYRRLDRAFKTISRELGNNGTLVRLPADYEVSQDATNSGMESVMAAELDDDPPPKSPTAVLMEGARPPMAPPADPEQFRKFLARTNRRRRKDQARQAER